MARKNNTKKVTRSVQNDGEGIVKHSGCKAGLDKNSKPYVQGWKVDKTNGMRKFYASPYHATKEIKAKTSGRVWHTWLVKIELPTGEVMLRPCMYAPDTKMVIIKDLSFVMNPKGGKGGYIGPFFTRS